MATQIKWKEIVIEHIDSIALLVTAFIAVVLAHLGKIPAESTNTVLLLILSFLAFHHFRRSLKIEKMHEQIGEINEKVSIIKKNNEIGIDCVYGARREISIPDMHSEIKISKNVFIAARYFKSFINEAAQNAFLECLKNNGTIKIIIYSPIGTHLNVNIERDIHPDEARIQLCRTLKYFKEFKNKLPPESKEHFEYKILEGNIIYVSIVGTSCKIYPTIYLNNLEGDECPMIVCVPFVRAETEGLYHKFSKEFDTLWEKGISEKEMETYEDLQKLCDSYRKKGNNMKKKVIQ